MKEILKKSIDLSELKHIAHEETEKPKDKRK